jgi:hypothetical protein
MATLTEADFDEIAEADSHVPGPSNRRNERDLARMLDLIENLPISENGKEGRH